MNIRARGSILFGFAVLLAVLSYFQPTTEAKEAFNIVIESKANAPQINQTNNQQSVLQTNLPTQNQQQNINEESSETNASAIVSAGRAFRATAYCLQGRTASGSGVRRGIVAADPRVLPLGTRIQITAGSYSGTYTVADTGGAVKGRILDIWVPSCSEAIRFGRKSITVAVVGGRKSKSAS
ncbi:MAG TPA: 3D domain-containing protein [Pyrinomonadaceae bacterium]|nr:3D domain-containing protein [Pyrinomonadaceae bacterium]